jgi:hypothetical protein
MPSFSKGKVISRAGVIRVGDEMLLVAVNSGRGVGT